MILPWNALLVARRDALVWRRYWTTSLVGILGEPAFYFVAFGFGLARLIDRRLGGMDYLTYVGTALPLAAAAAAAAFETTYGSFTRMERQRTFHAIISTPISIGEVALGEILWGAALATLSALGTAAVLLLFGALPPGAAAASVPLGFLVGAVFGAAGLLAAGLAKAYDHFQYFHYIGVSGVLLLSGAFFPVETFAAPLRLVARALPLTPAIEAVRAAARGEGAGGAFLLASSVALAWGLPLAAAAAAVVRRRVLR